MQASKASAWRSTIISEVRRIRAPNVFLWQAPSGRTLPAHNGWQYSKANDFGLANDSDEVFLEWLPKIEAYLTEIDYPLPFLMLEGYHPYGDNGSAWGAFAEFACRWNETGRSPPIITATPRMFWERVKTHQSDLETVRGDWTDYWNFGCISSARETSHRSHNPKPPLLDPTRFIAALNALSPSPSP